LVLLSLSYSVSKAQDVTNTGNLVTNNWVNGVPQNSLTCWSGGDPGYCGPNPIIRPDGQINFSYGTTDLHQQRAIAIALPDSGAGLRVNGFNFSFTAKNGNGWDDGRVDTLSAYAKFYGSAGAVVQDYNYNLNYKFNWTTFNYNETFLTPYASKDLSNVRYGFVGRDNNFWAGPYGPEIGNVSFSLKYSVDPCFSDPISSPSCPGYLEALNAKLPKAEVVAPTTATTTTVEVPVVVSTPTQTTTSTPTVTTTTVTTVAPTATTQPKVGEVQVGGKSTVSTSQILSIVRSEQAKVSAVESSVVQQANEQASTAAQSSQATSMSVAANAVSMSTSNSTSMNNAVRPQTSGIGLTFGGPQNTTSTQSYSLVSPTRSFDAESFRSENKTETRAGVPDFTQPKPQVMTEVQQQQNTSSVNRAAKDNEAAGGVTLVSMMKQPAGYDLYMTGMIDKPFYPPKEVYKNQKTVDNVRAQRMLNAKSDKLHEQMVDQQYQGR